MLLGDLSYGVYLWHYPAIIWLRTTDRWTPDLGEVLAMTVGLTVSAAALSWFLIERPVIRAARRAGRRVGRRPEHPAGTRRSQPAPATTG
jgi:peptidoglycan/LPS O-acetylase OafA/YrhL